MGDIVVKSAATGDRFTPFHAFKSPHSPSTTGWHPPSTGRNPSPVCVPRRRGRRFVQMEINPDAGLPQLPRIHLRVVRRLTTCFLASDLKGQVHATRLRLSAASGPTAGSGAWRAALLELHIGHADCPPLFGEPVPRCAGTRSTVGRSPFATSASAAPCTSTSVIPRGVALISFASALPR